MRSIFLNLCLFKFVRTICHGLHLLAITRQITYLHVSPLYWVVFYFPFLFLECLFRKWKKINVILYWDIKLTSSKVSHGKDFCSLYKWDLLGFWIDKKSRQPPSTSKSQKTFRGLCLGFLKYTHYQLLHQEVSSNLWVALPVDYWNYLGGLEESRRVAINHLVQCTWFRRFNLWSVGVVSWLFWLRLFCNDVF